MRTKAWLFTFYPHETCRPAVILKNSPRFYVCCCKFPQEKRCTVLYPLQLLSRFTINKLRHNNSRVCWQPLLLCMWKIWTGSMNESTWASWICSQHTSQSFIYNCQGSLCNSTLEKKKKKKKFMDTINHPNHRGCELHNTSVFQYVDGNWLWNVCFIH